MQWLNAPEIAHTWAQFRRFYGELAAVERELASGAATCALVDADATNGGAPDKAVLARDVFTRLHRTLGELGFGASRPADRRGGAGGIDAGYVMAALADEALLHRIDWPGQATWEAMLLEDALYGTRIAGEQIFAAAEEQAGGGSSFQPGLALAILLALQLGFRGRHRGVDDAGALQRLRPRLYELLCRQPWSPTLDWRGSFSAPYGPTLAEDRIGHLPPLKPWLTTIAAAVAGLLLITHVIWHSAVHGIVERADQVVGEANQVVEWRE